jgi:hypothetical protein
VLVLVLSCSPRFANRDVPDKDDVIRQDSTSGQRRESRGCRCLCEHRRGPGA